MIDQPIPSVTRADVLRVVRRDYPATSENEVLAVLDTYGKEQWHRAPERVHLAVLKLAAGDLRALRRNVATACEDPRDILAPAEYPTYSRHPSPDQLNPAELALLYENDWHQYEQWLTGK